MINSQDLINKICTVIAAGGMTSLQTCQTTGALTILSNPVVSVASFASLPSAVTYAGRLIYVNDENRYYHAVDGYWLNNLSGKVFNYYPALWSMGTAGGGRLGDNNVLNRSSPVSVVGGFTDWCQVSAGNENSVGVRTNGTAWAWGCNAAGQLGDGTIVDKSSPVSVIGGFTNWCQLSAGCRHVIGLRSNGTIWTWGQGFGGNLGDGTVNDKSSPVSVVGGFTDWCQVSSGYVHVLAVRSNGTAWAWGQSGYGRLGDGTIIQRTSPTSVVGGFTDWCQVSAGTFHSLGLRTNGTAWAWGRNDQGQLGDNTIVSKSSPVSVVGGFTDWCQVRAGGSHSLGIRLNGTLWAWGTAASGQLGDNTAVNKSSPVSVVGGFTDWCQVSAGSSHSIGVRTNGTAWGWGINNCGQLGDNTAVNKSSPVSVVGGNFWCQLSSESRANHSTGIRQTQKGF